MMHRSNQPEEINRLAGADMSPVVACPLHVCLVDGENLGVFAWRGPGIYEIHLAFAARGRTALDLLCRMIARLCDEHRARIFWAMIPVESRHVRMFARLAGFASDGFVTTQHGEQEVFVSEKSSCLFRQ